MFRDVNLMFVCCVVDDSFELIKFLYMLIYNIDEVYVCIIVSLGNIFIKK